MSWFRPCPKPRCFDGIDGKIRRSMFRTMICSCFRILCNANMWCSNIRRESKILEHSKTAKFNGLQSVCDVSFSTSDILFPFALFFYFCLALHLSSIPSCIILQSLIYHNCVDSIQCLGLQILQRGQGYPISGQQGENWTIKLFRCSFDLNRFLPFQFGTLSKLSEVVTVYLVFFSVREVAPTPKWPPP